MRLVTRSNVIRRRLARVQDSRNNSFLSTTGTAGVAGYISDKVTRNESTNCRHHYHTRTHKYVHIHTDAFARVLVIIATLMGKF